MTFEQFWAAYPRKTAKVTAARAWRKVAETDHVALMAGLEKAKTTHQWHEGVIPHASTWLNQRRWEDEDSSQAERGPMKAQRYLSEYRRRTGWWCRHVPTCETIEDCDELVLKRWRERGIV